MTPTKIIFTLHGVLNQYNDSNTARIINEAVTSAFNNRNNLSGQPFTRFAKENVIPNRKEQIESSLIEDNVWFTFTSAQFEPFDVIPDRTSGGYRADCTWEMHYTLFSVEYIWMEILPDRTIVCHRVDDSKIEFIPLNALKLQLAQ